MEDKQVVVNQKNKGLTPGRIFLYNIILYILLFVFYSVSFGSNPSVKTKWIIIGYAIGSLYVLMAFYYFYDHFLAPYITESKKNVSHDTSLVVRKGSVIATSRPNIYVWMLQWLVPVALIQAVVITGIIVTLEESAYFKGDVYAQPYLYGQLYKKIEGMTKSLNNANAKDREEEQRFSRAKSIEGEFAGYLDKYVTYDGLNREEYVKHVKSEVEMRFYRIPFLIALTFGFLGTLIYTLTDMVYRFNTSDLYPNTFINYLIRFFFAPVLCTVIAYFRMDDWWVSAAPLIFFFIGVFPQRAMQYIEEQALKLLSLKKEDEKKEIPLGLIQGMTDYVIYRLREIGIGDAQNLAYSDLSYLRNNLGLSDRQICDFVAQALLLVYLKDDFSKLQAFGIRNIIAFGQIVTSSNVEGISSLLSIPQKKLEGLLTVVSTSTVKNRVETLDAIMMAADTREQKRRMAGIKPATATA